MRDGQRIDDVELCLVDFAGHNTNHWAEAEVEIEEEIGIGRVQTGNIA